MRLQEEVLHPFKTEKPRNITTIKYVGLVCDLNSRMPYMPPLFNDNQQLDESELVDCLDVFYVALALRTLQSLEV